MGNLPRIGWILAGDYSLASSRLQGYRIHEYFVKSGIDSRIIATGFMHHDTRYSLELLFVLCRLILTRCGIVFFQKPGWMSFKLSEILRRLNVKTVAIQCDPFMGPYDKYFDELIVTAERLGKAIEQPHAIVIDDMIEVPPQFYKRSYRQTSEKLKLVWVGQGTGPGGKKFIIPFLHKLMGTQGLRLIVDVVTISRGEWATYQWSLKTVYSQICECDVAIIPLPSSEGCQVKSSNRLTMFMALGMPTIASPIESYLRIANNGHNCFISSSIDAFAEAIIACRSETIRKKMGTNAKQYARKHYSPDVVGKKWIELVSQLSNVNPEMR